MDNKSKTEPRGDKPIDRLLSRMEEEIEAGGSKASPVEKALWHALRFWRNDLPELDGYFHKAFRQTDVLDCADANMILWHLLDGSKLFWKLFNEVTAENDRWSWGSQCITVKEISLDEFSKTYIKPKDGADKLGNAQGGSLPPQENTDGRCNNVGKVVIDSTQPLTAIKERCFSCLHWKGKLVKDSAWCDSWNDDQYGNEVCARWVCRKSRTRRVSRKSDGGDAKS